MEQKRILRIVVASPGDVEGERKALIPVIEEINRGVADDRGLRLELTRWETDSYPGFHPEGPQGLIDPVLRIEDCDVLIGIFWKRFGTPTPDGKSGTEHEFRTAYEAWERNGRPAIMVYFNNKSYNPKTSDEANQWAKVLDFKQKFPKKGLWWAYKGKAQFADLVRQHLTNLIRQQFSPPTPPPLGQAVTGSLPLDPLPVEYVPRGRKNDVNEDLLELLKRKLAPAAEATLFVLSGPGGVGKTATAQQAVRALAAQYANRIVWIDARDYGPSVFSKLIDEINRRLDPGNRPPSDPENGKLKAQQLLAQGSTLIVIDDFETIPAEQQGWIDWIERSNPLTVLLITRDVSITRGAERVTQREDIVDMTPSEAQNFWERLIQRAQYPQVFTSPQPAEVIERFGTNPFFLFRGVFTHVDRLGEWGSIDEKLYSKEGEVARRIFSRSFELDQVGDHGRKLLLALSMFPQPASRKALAFVAGLDQSPEKFREAVANLLSLWLIRPVGSEGRLTLDRTYRRYARDHMNEQNLSDELQGRFVRHFVNYVESHVRLNDDDLDALEEEKDNIVEAINVAYGRDDFQSVTKMFDVLGRPHNGFFELRGYWDDAIRCGTLAIRAATVLGPEKKNELARFTYTAADFHAKRGDYEQAKSLLQPLVDDGGVSLDRHSYVNALHFMGMLEAREHRYEQAERLFRQELDVSQAEGQGDAYLRGVANSKHELGRVARLQGRFDEARRLYEESLRIRERLKNEDGSDDVAAPKSTLHELGLLAHKQGEWEQYLNGDQIKARELYDESSKFYEQSLRIKEMLGNKGSIAHTKTEQADLKRLQAANADSEERKARLYQEARALLGESLKINESIPDLLDIAYTKYTLGRVALDEGSVSEAQQLCDEAHDIWARYGDAAALAGCHYLEGLIAERQGKRIKAAGLYRAALDVWRDEGLIAADFARSALARVEAAT